MNKPETNFSEFQEAKHSQDDGGNLTFERIFGYVDLAWSVRHIVFTATVIGLMLGLLTVFVNRQANLVDHYDYTVRLTFQGVTEGTYPNGVPFLLTDIIAPAILNKVYRENKIGELGIDPDAFASQVKVTSHSVSERAIVEKYEAIFDARQSSLAEVEKYQRDLAAELNQEVRSSALIRLDDPDGKFTLATAQSVLISIAQAWSNQAISQKGVLREGIQVVSSSLFSPDSISGLENLNQLRVVLSRIGQLTNALEKISSSSVGLLATVPETGLSTLDVANQIETVKLKLREIASSWSEKAALEISSQRLNIRLYSGGAIDAETIGQEEYLVQLDMFTEALKVTRANLQTILNEPFGSIVTDPKSGFTAVDIERLVDDLSRFTIATIRAPIVQNGIAKKPENLVRYYKTQQSELKRDISELSRKIKTVSEALTPTQSASIADGESGSRSNSSPIVPQLGQDFIDRIIELSSLGNDAEFRRGLTKISIDFRNESAGIEKELERIDEYINTVQKNIRGDRSIEEKQRAGDLKVFVETELASIFQQISRSTDAIIRISRRLRYADTVHEILEPKDSPVVSIDFYLRDDIKPKSDLKLVMNDLSKIAQSISRLGKEVSNDTYGAAQRLYLPLSTPYKTKSGLFGPRSILLIVGFGLLFFFGSLLVGMLHRRLKRKT